MSYLYMGFSFGDEFEKKEGVVVPMEDETGIEFEFWPIQHPNEPSHEEDMPVQCPMPHSSPLINGARMDEDRFSDRKRPEASTILSAVKEAEAPIRAVRKRHHTHTQQDHPNLITPLVQMPPVYEFGSSPLLQK